MESLEKDNHDFCCFFEAWELRHSRVGMRTHQYQSATDYSEGGFQLTITYRLGSVGGVTIVLIRNLEPSLDTSYCAAPPQDAVGIGTVPVLNNVTGVAALKFGSVLTETDIRVTSRVK
jgi:hypothetical protein